MRWVNSARFDKQDQHTVILVLQRNHVPALPRLAAVGHAVQLACSLSIIEEQCQVRLQDWVLHLLLARF